MKTVKSKSDLTRLAVQRGARVTLPDGGTINSSGTKRDMPRQERSALSADKQALAPALAPAIVAAPPVDDSNTSLEIARLATELLKMSQREEKDEAKNEKKEPTAWVFDIRRGSDGMMSQIIATPVAVKS
jgi:hypothetical protein